MTHLEEPNLLLHQRVFEAICDRAPELARQRMSLLLNDWLSRFDRHEVLVTRNKRRLATIMDKSARTCPSLRRGVANPFNRLRWAQKKRPSLAESPCCNVQQIERQLEPRSICAGFIRPKPNWGRLE